MADMFDFGKFAGGMSDVVATLQQLKGDDKAAFEKKVAETRRRRQPPEKMLADLLRREHHLVNGHLKPIN